MIPTWCRYHFAVTKHMATRGIPATKSETPSQITQLVILDPTDKLVAAGRRLFLGTVCFSWGQLLFC